MKTKTLTSLRGSEEGKESQQTRTTVLVFLYIYVYIYVQDKFIHLNRKTHSTKRKKDKINPLYNSVHQYLTLHRSVQYVKWTGDEGRENIGDNKKTKQTH